MSLALGAVAAQGLLGLGQTIAGMVKKKPIIPEADVPEEVFQNMTDAEYRSFIGMPSDQRQRYIEDIQRTGATALSRVQDRKGGLGAVANIAQNEGNQYRTLAGMDIDLRNQNINRLYAARDRVAQEKNRAADINRNIALDERGRRDEMIGAGMQNMMGGLGTGSTMSAMFPEQFGGMFGGNKRAANSGGAGVQPNAGTGGGGFDFGGVGSTETYTPYSN